MKCFYNKSMRKCCRTLLLGVQISRETTTNIAQYLYLSYSPDHMHGKFKAVKLWEVKILVKENVR